MLFTEYEQGSAASSITAELKTEVELCIRRAGAAESHFSRALLLAEFYAVGWSNKVKVASELEITITSRKDNVGLCIQFGNMARMYADLLKTQYMCDKGSIALAIMIVPTTEFARELGSNLANFERLVKELKVFKRTITLPILIYGVSR